MEFADEETIRYAFLLGSSLKNQDPDQFIEIYDTIIPGHLPCEQIDAIKDIAILISDLPEEEYNSLVVQARDFSLAKSSLALAMLNNNNHTQPASDTSRTPVCSSALSSLQYMAMEDDLGPGKLRRTKQTSMRSVELSMPSGEYSSPSIEHSFHSVEHSFPSVERTSRHMSPYNKMAEQEDNDSGVEFNASKNTIGSVSDHDLPDSLINQTARDGCFDYFDGSQTDSTLTGTVLCHSSRASFNRVVSIKEQEHLHDEAYDYSIDVDSDTDKPDCFDSPTEFEMKTYKIHETGHGDHTGKIFEADRILQNKVMQQRNNKTYDEVHPCESDNGCEDFKDVECTNNLHKILYSQAKDYSSVKTNYNQDGYGKTISRAKSSYGSSSGGSKEKDHIYTSLPNYGATQHYNTSSTINVDCAVDFPLSRNRNSSGEEKVVKRHDIRVPPFGDPPNVRAIHRTGERLIDGKGMRSEHIPNLPRAALISERGQLELGAAYTLNNDDKKKRKKKKEDGGEDENGNPLECDGIGGGASSSGIERRESSIFPQKIGNFTNSYLPGGRDLGDNTMSPALDSQGRKQRTRKRKKEKSTIISDNIPGYVGSKPLEELLSYIGGANGTGHSNQKRPQSTAPGVTHGQVDREKAFPEMLSAVNNMTFPNTHDNVMNNMQTKTDKSKKKKKSKPGTGVGSKASSEVDDKSSHVSESDLDKVKDTFSEGSVSSDVMTSINGISSRKTSSIGDEENIPNHVSPNYNSTGEPYIFTDFEPKVHKEEQFTVVSKIKKKKKSMPIGRDFYKEVMSDYRKEDVPSRRPSRPPPRSFTPPPSTASVSKPEGSSERTLSPSAFPVLGKSREARRNSTGNLAELERSYDSDLESVKSVPPTGSASDIIKTGADISTAGGKPPISYASIAAGGRGSCHNGSTSSQDGDQNSACNGAIVQHTSSEATTNAEVISVEESDLSVSVGDCNIDVIRESVYSGGGSTRPSSASSSNISGAKPELSQLDTNKALTSPVVSIANSNLNSSAMVPESVVTAMAEDLCPKALVQAAETVCSEPLHKEEPLNVSNTVDFPALSPSVPASQNIKSSTTTTTTSNSQSANRNSVSPVIESQQADPVSPNISQSSTSSSSARPRVPCKNGPKEIVAKPPATPIRNSTLKSKNKTSKSVVFLDRRMNERPANLDISFGFEPDLVNNVMISARLDSSGSCSSDSGRGTDSDILVHTVINKGSNSASIPTNSIENRTPIAPGVIIVDGNRAGDNNNAPFSLTSNQLLNNQCQNQFVFIGPEQPDLPNPVTFTAEELHKFKVIAPPNGVIAPRPTYVQPAAPSKEITIANNNQVNATQQCTDNKSENNTPAESITESSDQHNKEKPPTIVFTYDRSKDPNFEAGNFNHEAGVAFLYTDWQKFHNSAQRYEDQSGMSAC